MSKTFILKGKQLIPCDDLLKWATEFESTDHRVAVSEQNDVRVSTVFLGVDHSFGKSKPLLFETMIFGGEHDQFQERCSTWQEAEQMHQRACKLVGIEP